MPRNSVGFDHREAVGGLWDEIGLLQFEFLKTHGLKPHHALLDIGCGSFRGGVYFAGYLDAGNYFGIDGNGALIAAGFESELKPLGLDEKVPRTNVLESGEFEFERLGQTFDVALAHSLFTHLPLNSIRVCLERLLPCCTPNATFYATFFLCEAGSLIGTPKTHFPGGITTYADKDPYHYRFADLEYVAVDTGWGVDFHGDFGHPRSQQMAIFRPR